MDSFSHKPVMLNECIDALQIKPDGIYLDGTLGAGGHSSEILRRLTSGRLIAIDRDLLAIENAEKTLAWAGDKLSLVHGNFSDIGAILKSQGVTEVSGMLFDCGLSSPQIDSPDRGFSYTADAPLDMRADRTQSLTAGEIVNTWSENDIRRILRDYGEERYANRIAKAVIARRANREIATTLELVEIIRGAMPAKALREKQHPAKRSFMGLRIAVNAELDALHEMMESATELLAKGGRLATISFHSLEDRIVKRAIAAREKGCTCPRGLPVCACGFVQTLKSVGKNPKVPSEAELAENPRARSAKLRVAERI